MAPPPIDGTETTRAVFLTGLGLVLLVAHLSLGVQLAGLVGPDGILPADAFLRDVEAALDGRRLLPSVGDSGDAAWAHAWDALRRGVAKLTWLPTLGWWLPAGWGPTILVATGALASVFVTLRRLAGPALLVAWGTYLSLSMLGQDFLAFQWDQLLVEVTFAGLLVAPWGRTPTAVPPAGWWLLRWILFRLVFFGGLVKLTSGDPTWRDLSALTYHYETQPLPNPLSIVAHRLPWWLHAVSTVATLGLELVLPFAMFAGRTGRLAVFVGVVALMGLLATTGNYGWFQLLTIVLAVSLLDDGHFERVLRRQPPARPAPTQATTVAVTSVAALLIAASVVTAVPRYLDASLPTPLARVAGALAPWRIVNHYGLFARMTTERPIPILEARWDDGPWTELTWRWQSSDPARGPAQVAPHMPRLDWQLWFAGLGGSCADEPWTQALMLRVLQGSDPVDGLIGDLRLRTGRPPDAVRMTLWRYRFAERGAPTPWVREPLGVFCEAVTAEVAGVRVR